MAPRALAKAGGFEFYLAGKIAPSTVRIASARVGAGADQSKADSGKPPRTIRSTCSPIANEAVKPGDSMPYKPR